MGAWAEDIAMQALNATERYAVYRYGVSYGKPMTLDEFKEYSRHILDLRDAYGKRPDLLVFKSEAIKPLAQDSGERLSKLVELDESDTAEFLNIAVAALEVETSLWKLARNDSLSFTIKEEDIEPLKKWTSLHSKIPLFVCQMFYDGCYALAFDRFLDLVARSVIAPKMRGSSRKLTYYIPLNYGFEFAKSIAPPTIQAMVLESEKGQLMPFAAFSNGKFEISEPALAELSKLSQ